MVMNDAAFTNKLAAYGSHLGKLLGARLDALSENGFKLALEHALPIKSTRYVPGSDERGQRSLDGGSSKDEHVDQRETATFLHDWLIDPGDKRLILAPFGFGKSCQLAAFAARFAQDLAGYTPNSTRTPIVPMPVRLRLFNRLPDADKPHSNATWRRFLVDSQEAFDVPEAGRLDEDDLRRLAEGDGRLVLLYDGFDELADANRRLVLARMEAFEPDVGYVLSSREPVPGFTAEQTLKLQPLASSDITERFDTVFASDPERRSAVEKRLGELEPIVGEVVRRPLFLSAWIDQASASLDPTLADLPGDIPSLLQTATLRTFDRAESVRRDVVDFDVPATIDERVAKFDDLGLCLLADAARGFDAAFRTLSERTELSRAAVGKASAPTDYDAAATTRLALELGLVQASGGSYMAEKVPVVEYLIGRYLVRMAEGDDADRRGLVELLRRWCYRADVVDTLDYFWWSMARNSDGRGRELAEALVTWMLNVAERSAARVMRKGEEAPDALPDCAVRPIILAAIRAADRLASEQVERCFDIHGDGYEERYTFYWDQVLPDRLRPSTFQAWFPKLLDRWVADAENERGDDYSPGLRVRWIDRESFLTLYTEVLHGERFATVGRSKLSSVVEKAAETFGGSDVVEVIHELCEITAAAAEDVVKEARLSPIYHMRDAIPVSAALSAFERWMQRFLDDPTKPIFASAMTAAAGRLPNDKAEAVMAQLVPYTNSEPQPRGFSRNGGPFGDALEAAAGRLPPARAEELVRTIFTAGQVRQIAKVDGIILLAAIEQLEPNRAALIALDVLDVLDGLDGLDTLHTPNGVDPQRVLYKLSQRMGGQHAFEVFERVLALWVGQGFKSSVIEMAIKNIGEHVPVRRLPEVMDKLLAVVPLASRAKRPDLGKSLQRSGERLLARDAELLLDELIEDVSALLPARSDFESKSDFVHECRAWNRVIDRTAGRVSSDFAKDNVERWIGEYFAREDPEAELYGQAWEGALQQMTGPGLDKIFDRWLRFYEAAEGDRKDVWKYYLGDLLWQFSEPAEIVSVYDRVPTLTDFLTPQHFVVGNALCHLLVGGAFGNDRGVAVLAGGDRVVLDPELDALPRSLDELIRPKLIPATEAARQMKMAELTPTNPSRLVSQMKVEGALNPDWDVKRQGGLPAEVFWRFFAQRRDQRDLDKLRR